MDNVKLLELTKQIDRLTKRNKLLTKRLKKLHEENQSLTKELDDLDQLQEHGKSYKRVPTLEDLCPKCGNHLDTSNIYGEKILYICSNFPKCTYKGIF